MAETFFQGVLKQARERNLLSDEHPTVGFWNEHFPFAGADANFRIYNPAFGHFNHRPFASLNGTTTDSVRKVWRDRPSPQVSCFGDGDYVKERGPRLSPRTLIVNPSKQQVIRRYPGRH